MKTLTTSAPMATLESIARIQKGSTITAKNAVHGNVPVIAGGTKPAYFHNESNRAANAITVSASGAAGYVSFHPYPIFASDCITVESLDLDVVDQRYLFLALLSMQDHIYSLSRGTALQHVYAKDLKSLKIPVPVIDDQRRIVSELDNQLSRLEKALVDVKKAQSKSRLLELSFLEKLIDESMVRVRLGEVTLTSGYGTSTKCVVGGQGVSVARIPNLVDGTIDMSDEKRVQNPDLDLSNLMLEEGDLLVIRTNGSQNLVGTTAVVPKNIVASFASYLIRFKVDRARVDPRWVHVMFGSSEVRRQVVELSASSAGQYNLGLSKLNSITLPLPSIEVQNQILEALQNMKSSADSLNREQAKLVARVDDLRRSLLNQSFTGGLAHA